MSPFGVSQYTASPLTAIRVGDGTSLARVVTTPPEVGMLETRPAPLSVQYSVPPLIARSMSWQSVPPGTTTTGAGPLLPWMQAAVPSHVWPQQPQLLGSVSTSTHVSAQTFGKPDRHRQAPSLQPPPLAHMPEGSVSSPKGAQSGGSPEVPATPVVPAAAVPAAPVPAVGVSMALAPAAPEVPALPLGPAAEEPPLVPAPPALPGSDLPPQAATSAIAHRAKRAACFILVSKISSGAGRRTQRRRAATGCRMTQLYSEGWP
jgi:hypothetical protein